VAPLAPRRKRATLSSGLPLHSFMSLKFFAICPDHLTK
jgi:hypothetical protein